MDRKYKKKKGENFTDWCERLSKIVIIDRLSHKELFEVFNEVSKVSYIEGIHVEKEVTKKINQIEFSKNELTRYRV